MARINLLGAALGLFSLASALVFALRDVRPWPANPADSEQAPLGFDELAQRVGLHDLAPGWGLSWADADCDGDPDLFVSNHLHYPSYLYSNEGGVSFRRSETKLGDQVDLDDHLGAWCDVDLDGYPDLYTANGYHRVDHLMVNVGPGEYADRSEQYGLIHGELSRGRSALWADLDGDRWLDLVVFSFLTPDLLYVREPGAGFEERSMDSGFGNSLPKEGGIVGDVDNDGDLDLYLPVLAGSVRNALYLNRGDATFVEASKPAGVDVPGASYSAAFGDFDNDGYLDLFLALSDGLPDRLLRNRGDGTFEDVSARAGVASSGEGMRAVGFGDFDNDGYLDVYIVAGGAYDGRNQPNLLYRNNRDGSFRNATDEAGVAALTGGNGSSFAMADANLDGYIDFAVTNGGGARAICGPHLYFRNRGGQASSVFVMPRGLDGNPYGYGARVQVRRPDGSTLYRDAGGFRVLAQDDAWVHAGLARESHASEVLVRWTSGRTARLQGVPAGERVVVREGRVDRWVDSHPAALLGEVPGFDLEYVEARVLERLAGVWPEPDADDLARREEGLLAWALARTLADAVPQARGAAFNLVWKPLRAKLGLPRRFWIDHAAIGPFTTFLRRQPIHTDVARIAAELEAGRDLLDVFLEPDIDVRAWARVFKVGTSFEPALNALDTTERGFFESGWMTSEMLEERFGELANQIESMQTGEVLGPNEQTFLPEGRDLQEVSEEGRPWELERIVHMGEKQRSTYATRQEFGDDVMRSKWRADVARVFGNVEPGESVDYCYKVPFDRAHLARRAREEGLADSHDVRVALARVRREARLDRALRELAARATPTPAAVAERVRRRQIAWTRPQRVVCARFFFTDADIAAEVRGRLERGDSIESVIEEFKIPSITQPEARASARRHGLALRDRHLEKAVVDEALWSRTILDRSFEELTSRSPGQVSDLLPTEDGYFLFFIERVIADEALDAERARALARTELEREALDALANELLYAGPHDG
jgi:hypothetical protein